MTQIQRVIKYVAMGLALLLAVAIIGGVVSVVSLFVDADDITAERTVYPISSAVTSLDIEVGAADLTIKQGDRFLVESNLKGLTVREDGDTLTVRHKKGVFRIEHDVVLTVTVPAQTLKQVTIATGAGRLTVDALSADVVELELGAGEVTINDLTVSREGQIDGGAGKLTVNGGKLHDLSLNMGVGQLSLTGELIGECEMDLGVGETNFILQGGKDKYTLDIEKGLGDVSVDGTDVSRFGNGPNRIDIDGGVGAICIDFE